MSLSFTRSEFVECPTCQAKPGSPELCRECLERRELWWVVDEIRKGQMSFIDKLLCLIYPPHGYEAPARKTTSIAELVRICHHCEGSPNPECPEHGR